MLLVTLEEGMRCVKALQLTLAVVKPDAVAHPLILEVRLSCTCLIIEIIKEKNQRTMWSLHYIDHVDALFLSPLDFSN